MYANVTVPTIFIILCHSKCPLADEEIGKRQRYKLNTEAELAFFGRHLGFINNRRGQGQSFYDLLRMYVELKSEHEIRWEDVPQNLMEELSALMKIELCQKYLNESLLRYNKIFFDEGASLERLSIVEMAVEFQHHDVPTILDKFIRCPITSEFESVDSLYMTMVEKARFEREDHYYIFVEEKPGFVAPFMRSRYNYSSLLNDVSASLRSFAMKFADTFLSMAENSEDLKDPLGKRITYRDKFWKSSNR